MDNLRFMARVMGNYLSWAAVVALSLFLIRLVRSMVELLDLVVKMPESFFTNKTLFLLLIAVGACSLVVYWFTELLWSLIKYSLAASKNLVSPWRCTHGGKRCEVGKKGVEVPSILCARHYLERLDARMAVAQMTGSHKRGRR
jgi:hypothetical protein